MIHIIASDEATLHEESQYCRCYPVVDVDETSGELICTHLPLTINLKGITNEADFHEPDLQQDATEA